MDLDPSTGLTVLVECLVLSRPNKTSFSIYWVNCCSPTGLTVLDNWVFGFGWIRWVPLLLPAASESNSFIQLSLKEIVGGGRSDTYTFSKMTSPDSITTTFEIISILYAEQAVYRPNTQCPGVFSTSSACTMQDVVWSSQACTDLCVPCPWDSQP